MNAIEQQVSFESQNSENTDFTVQLGYSRNHVYNLSFISRFENNQHGPKALEVLVIWDKF